MQPSDFITTILDLTYMDIISTIAINFIYFLAVIFLFVLLASDKEYRWQAFIIVCYCALTVMMPDLDKTGLQYKRIWTNQAFVCLMINGAAMAAMLATSFFGRLNILQSNILLFGVVLHYVLTSKLELELNVKSEDVTLFMKLAYYWYYELIILMYILMILVSKNGIHRAYINTLSSLQRRIYGDDVYYNSFVDGAFKPEEARKRK